MPPNPAGFENLAGHWKVMEEQAAEHGHTVDRSKWRMMGPMYIAETEEEIAGAQANLVLIISAVTCITLAHVLYYVAIHEIGVALAQTLQLLCPAIAMALSAWIYHERLTHAQVWSAGVLLLGAFLAMRVKPVATAETAENI